MAVCLCMEGHPRHKNHRAHEFGVKTLLNPRTRLSRLDEGSHRRDSKLRSSCQSLGRCCLIQHISTNLFVGQLYVSDSSDSPNNKMASGGWRSIKCHNCPRHPVQDVNCREATLSPIGCQSGACQSRPQSISTPVPGKTC